MGAEQQPRLLVTVCGRAGSKGFRNKNLKTFCDKPLVYYTLSAVELFLAAQPQLRADVVLNTDSEPLRELVQRKYPYLRHIPRPAALAGDRVAKMEVFQQSLRVMEQESGRYDYLLDLDITSPLRTAEDIAGCFALLQSRPDLQLVMSAAPSRRSPYMNMAKRVGDHVEQVIQTSFTARQQTPVCYDLNASIYLFRRDFLAENTTGFIWDAKSDIFEMRDTGVLDIDSEEDFALMEVIARHLYQSWPALARVRENIG